MGLHLGLGQMSFLVMAGALKWPLRINSFSRRFLFLEMFGSSLPTGFLDLWRFWSMGGRTVLDWSLVVYSSSNSATILCPCWIAMSRAVNPFCGWTFTWIYTLFVGDIIQLNLLAFFKVASIYQDFKAINTLYTNYYHYIFDDWPFKNNVRRDIEIPFIKRSIYADCRRQSSLNKWTITSHNPHSTHRSLKEWISSMCQEKGNNFLVSNLSCHVQRSEDILN